MERQPATYYFDNGTGTAGVGTAENHWRGLKAVPCEVGKEEGTLYRPGEDQPFTTGAVKSDAPANGTYVIAEKPKKKISSDQPA